MTECVFCKILLEPNHPQIIKRGRWVTAIHKHYDSKNINFMIVAIDHCFNYKSLNPVQRSLISAETVEMAHQLLPDADWSMKQNNGPRASQTVFHLHTHIYSTAYWPKHLKPK